MGSQHQDFLKTTQCFLPLSLSSKMFVSTSMQVILSLTAISGMLGVEGRPTSSDELAKIVDHINQVSVTIGAPKIDWRTHLTQKFGPKERVKMSRRILRHYIRMRDESEQDHLFRTDDHRARMLRK